MQTFSKIVLFLNEDKSRKIPFQKTDIKKLTKDFIDKYFQTNAKNKINFKTLNSPPPEPCFRLKEVRGIFACIKCNDIVTSNI